MVLAALALLSVAGVVIAAGKGRRWTETLAARYLLLLVLLAACGSLVDRFPFGPTNEVPSLREVATCCGWCRPSPSD
jgi:hypothetical protein